MTVCTHDRMCLFGDVVDGKMRLNDAGLMINNVWNEIPKWYPGVDIDEYAVMPNHFHGIVILKNYDVGAPPCGRPEPRDTIMIHGQARGPAPTTVKRLTLSDVIHRFKSLTTNKYIHGVKQFQWKPFHRALWQRTFHDRIIRNETELHTIREYIMNNPLQWEYDENNPNKMNQNTNNENAIS